jgi:hypothetical protein
VLRLVVSIFFVVFYIASLSVFLMALQCNYFNKDKAKRFHLEHFESGACCGHCMALPGPQRALHALMQHLQSECWTA